LYIQKLLYIQLTYSIRASGILSLTATGQQKVEKTKKRAMIEINALNLL
jgi:hypothetical protein